MSKETPNRVEMTVLEALLADPLLAGRVRTNELRRLVSASREMTGQGFITQLENTESARLFESDVNLRWGSRIDATVNGEVRVGFVVFVDEGRVDAVEGFTYEEEWPETVEKLELTRSWESPGSLASLSAEGLVDLVVEDGGRHFKRVSAELEGRLPSRAFARGLADAHERGDAPGWLVAHLLGQNGHEAGYETVRAVLLAGQRMLSESYAGIAMGRIRGQAAVEDLVEVMREGDTKWVREGAVDGLAHLEAAGQLDVVVEAVRARAISPRAAASYLDSVRPGDAELLAWLRDPDPRVARMASYHLHRAVVLSGGEVSNEIERAVAQAQLDAKIRRELLEAFGD